jgi:hypothetical protein
MDICQYCDQTIWRTGGRWEDSAGDPVCSGDGPHIPRGEDDDDVA